MSWTNKIIISGFFTVPAASHHLMPGTPGLAARSSIWRGLGGSSSPPAPDSGWVCKPGMLTPSPLTISDGGFKSRLVSPYYLSNPCLNWPGRKRRSGSVCCGTELSWFPHPPWEFRQRQAWVAPSLSRRHFASLSATVASDKLPSNFLLSKM